MPHLHVCGFMLPEDIPDPEPEELALFNKEGCGHVWRHEDIPDKLAIRMEPEEFKAAQIARHTCPNCGQGPYRNRLNQSTWNVYKARIEKLRSAKHDYPPAYWTAKAIASSHGSV